MTPVFEHESEECLPIDPISALILDRSQLSGQVSSAPYTHKWRHYECTSHRRAGLDRILPVKVR
jgi:hypothetical protein